jgi:hypothetical protein
MPPDLRARLEESWQANKRNRLLMLIGTGVVVVALLCGCLFLVGSFIGNSLTSLASSSNPGARPTLPVGTQVAQTNPTFPLPQPTAYNAPTGGATPVGSSGTPAPTPTASPSPSVTDTPPPSTPSPTDTPGGGGNGNGKITYQFAPNPAGLTAGQSNQIMLSGPPGTPVSLSIYLPGSNSCVSMNTVLDGGGQATLNCTVPANLKGITVPMSIQTPTKYSNYPVPIL